MCILTRDRMTETLVAGVVVETTPWLAADGVLAGDFDVMHEAIRLDKIRRCLLGATQTKRSTSPEV